MRTVSQSVLRGMMAEDTQFVAAILLEISDGTNTLYFTNNGEDVVHLGNTYKAFPFQTRFPTDNKDQPSAQIQITNVDQTVISFLQGLQTAPQIILKGVVFEPPFGSPPTQDNVEFGPATLHLRSFDATAKTISGNIQYKHDFLNQQWPRWSFTPENTPGVFKNI